MSRKSIISVEGGDFTCPNCGAVYEVTIWSRPKEAMDFAKCQKCKSVMLEWVDTVARSFKLKEA